MSIRPGCATGTGTARTGATRRGKSAREAVMATSSDAIMASVFLAQRDVLASLSAPTQVMSSSARIQVLGSVKAVVELKGLALLLNKFAMAMRIALELKMRLQKDATMEAVRLAMVGANITATRMLVGSAALVSLVTGWKVKLLVWKWTNVQNRLECVPNCATTRQAASSVRAKRDMSRTRKARHVAKLGKVIHLSFSPTRWIFASCHWIGQQ